MALLGIFGKKEEKNEELIADTPSAHLEKALGWHKLPMAGGAVELSPASGYTAFPAPQQTLRLIYESERKFIEETYYWILNFMRYSGAARMPNVDKVLDTFQGSVQSSSFGQQAQRQAIQQDRASQYLRGISEMTKQLHQLLRDLRIMDERLSYYDQTFESETSESADIALKGLWIDMVEGGAKNPGSVYGMQQNLSFATLPDLFFSTRVRGEAEAGITRQMPITEYQNKTKKLLGQIDERVDKLEFNNKVKEVLKRKLFQFYTWKYRTYQELKQRRTFSLKYLRQHYNTIKLYSEWVKPYLQNVVRLSGSQRIQNQPDIVSGFESSVLELELLAKTGKGEGPYKAVVSIHLRFLTTPQFSFTTPDYQNRGPVHSGRMEITYRSYGLTDKEIELYKQMREEESIEYVKAYDASVAEMLDSMSSDLAEYLKEAGEDIRTPAEKEREEAKKRLEELQNENPDQNPFFLITDTFEGFKELFGSLGVHKMLDFSSSSNEPSKDEVEKMRTKAARTAANQLYAAYNLYKKSHQFMTP